MATGSDRVRRRQGGAKLRDGIPYSNSRGTLSLLPGAAIGEWLFRHAGDVHGRLLDAGCGNRPFAEWYQPLVDVAVCLDAAPIDGVDVVGFADRLPFAPRSFDTILATEVLEHVEDAERAVTDFARLLTPGGHLLVTVPFLYPTHEAPYDFRRLTHFGLRSLLERNGLEVVSLDTKGGAPLLVFHAFVLAVVGGLDACASLLHLSRPLTDRTLVRTLLAAPQEAAIRIRARGAGQDRPVRGSSGRVSLGYMAVARKR